MHTLEEGTDASIVLAPEVVRNFEILADFSPGVSHLYTERKVVKVFIHNIQDNATAGTSTVAAGMVPEGLPLVNFRLGRSKWKENSVTSGWDWEDYAQKCAKKRMMFVSK